MIRRIAVLHTVVFLAEMFRRLFQENLPDAESFQMVDKAFEARLSGNIAEHDRLVKEAIG